MASVAREHTSLKRLRLALTALVLALALLAAALYVLLRSGSDNAATVVPAGDEPSATWPAGAERAPAFTLRDENGKPVALAAYRGRPVIVTFVDPLCRDFCPTEARRLNDAVRRAGGGAVIIAVSTNVWGNARPVLRQDRAKWDVVPQWRWAVGSRAQLGRVWRDYGVQVVETTKTRGGVTVHDVGHTLVAYVVDGEGSKRAALLWPFTANAVVTALRGLSPS